MQWLIVSEGEILLQKGGEGVDGGDGVPGDVHEGCCPLAARVVVDGEEALPGELGVVRKLLEALERVAAVGQGRVITVLELNLLHLRIHHSQGGAEQIDGVGDVIRVLSINAPLSGMALDSNDLGVGNLHNFFLFFVCFLKKMALFLLFFSCSVLQFSWA